MPRIRRYRPASGFLPALVFAALAAVWLPGALRASTLTVIGDVNAGSAANLRLYENVLGGGDEVLFARSFGQLGGVVSHYRSLGAAVNDRAAPLTEAVLADVDLLVLTTSYNTQLAFSEPEFTAMRAHAEAGRAILFVAEGNAAAALDSYNAALAGIGARIRFTGARFAQTEELTDLPETALTDGLSGFRVSPYSTLSGGTSAVVASNGAVVAFETLGAPAPVALPPALPMLAGGVGVLVMLGAFRQRR